MQLAIGLAADRRALGHQHRAGVEAFFHAHDHDAGFRIARHDRALDRRGAAPARQQRAMQIEAAELRRIEDRLRQQQSIGDDDRRIECRARRTVPAASASFSVSGVRTASLCVEREFVRPATARSRGRAPSGAAAANRRRRCRGPAPISSASVGTAKSGVPMKASAGRRSLAGRVSPRLLAAALRLSGRVCLAAPSSA